jgi:hypothetical protein
VKTEDGAVYTGKLNTPETPAGQPVTIQVVETPEHEVELERTQIVKMAETSDRFWQRFNGEISSGIIYSKGNQSTQYNVGSDAAYIRERWNASGNLSSSLSSSTGTNVSTRNDLQLGASRLLRWDNYFYAGLGNFLQSLGARGPGLAEHGLRPIHYPARSAKSRSGRDCRGGEALQVQQNESEYKCSAAASSLPTRPGAFQYQRVLLREAVQQSQMEHIVLRQLGQPATI